MGSLLLQLAKAAGARLVIAGSEEKLRLALSLGANMGANYSTSDRVGRVRDATAGGADIVYELVGGTVTKACLNALDTF